VQRADSSSRRRTGSNALTLMEIGPITGTATLRRCIVPVTTRYAVDFTYSPSGEVLMTSVRSTEEPCAAKVARTVLETSGGSDPLTEFTQALRYGVLWRKCSQGTASDKGKQWVERLLSLKETCRLHTVSTCHVLVDAVSSFF
jgi:hypothetical protein